MTEPNRWKIEGATPEARAIIEELLTDEVMRAIEAEAAGEAARRAPDGAEIDPEAPVGHWMKRRFIDGPDSVPAPRVPGWGVMTCSIHTDCAAGAVRPEFATHERPRGAGRHLAVVSGRGHGKTAALRRWLADATGLNYRASRNG